MNKKFSHLLNLVIFSLSPLCFQSCTIEQGAEIIIIQRTIPDPESIKLAKDIEAALRSHTELQNYEVKAKVDNKNIELSGEVNLEKDKDSIQQIIASISPYTIINNLSVAKQVSDEEITAMAYESLKINSIPNLNNIILNTKSGVVYLSATWSKHEEIDEILSIVLNVDGVKDVKVEGTGTPHI